MPTLSYWNLSPVGMSQIEQALALLQWAAPEHYGHILREIQGVKYLGGDGCGVNAIACTSGPHGRWIVLTSPPEWSPLVEVAVTLSHEARHHFTDPWGQHQNIPHRCTDCSSPNQRAIDPIYQADELLRQQLLTALSPPPPMLGAWSPQSATISPVHLALIAMSWRRPSVDPTAAAVAGLLALAAVGLLAAERRSW